MIDLLKSIFSDNPQIIILGFGKEGRSSYAFIRRNFPNLQLTIADLNKEIANESELINDSNLVLITGNKYQSDLDNYDIIIKSPGVKIKKLSNKLLKKITSQTDLFLQYYASQVIGVTGTKGKSTTVSLIKHVAKADNKKVMLLGNIGVAAFDMIDGIENDTIIIYELSAHQLEYLKKSPHVAVLLNVFPEHLDYFDDYDDYREAKFNICKFQNIEDCLIIHDSLVDELKVRQQSIESKEQINSKQINYVSDSKLDFEIRTTKLIGNHNKVNINMALLAAKEIGIDIDVALDSIESFESLPHRLEFVGEAKGIRFVNDSISTIPQSTKAAVIALQDVDTLILGGYDRGLDYNAMIDFLAETDISNFIFIGKAGNRMFDYFRTISNKNLIKASSIGNVFSTIFKITKKGSICLLSPAAASYDQFHNFEHRGDVFKGLVVKFEGIN